MNPSSNSAVPDANVEDMSNAELFQYLFKAELGAGGDLPAAFTDVLLQQQQHDQQNEVAPYSPSSSTASTIAHSPYATALSPTASTSLSHHGSPISSTLSYNTSPPYSHIDNVSPQEQQIQATLQLQSPTTPSSTYPMLLPSSMFSYRQISADMPPATPTPQITLAGLPDSADPEDQFLSLAHTATATTSSTTMPPEQRPFWMQRFQQLQQLQQMHHHHQQQLLVSPLFSANSAFAQGLNTSSTASSPQEHRSSSSDRSVSPSSPASKASSSHSNSPSVKSERIYPSPPMKDDVDMDSDDDDEPNHYDAGGPDPLKPSPSELKKMTSKERRQLRNKLSARNFRVRRKEYINTLETQVKEARQEAAELQKKLAQSELNCQFLRQKLETARLSQTLFNDGRMSKEHANLLASLLNPNTESFPTTSSDNLITVQQQQEQQQRELMDSINHNNMMILNSSLTAVQPQTTSLSDVSVSQGSLEPFVPFDGNWDLLVNRAEMVIDPVLDSKDVQSKEAVFHDLLARYEAAKQEAEVDEQMRIELKAFHEQKLAQTYIIMPKDDPMLMASSKASQDSLLLQTMVYMMMIHLTRSLFQAATLSNTQLVNVYQTMDEPLRSKMGQEQKQRPHCKFAEWREAWIRKCWPSFYNNRQRVCELLKNGLCPSAALSCGVDVDETVRKMEEGVKDKTVEPQSEPFCLWLRNCIGSWLRCPEYLARQEREERERLLNESKSSSSLEMIA
ncbi:hypothetical protein EDD11_009159 [Mortierella claussenii]|nr:hypothetical protein EDD11_009159 [Mortierella claussenii]